MFLITNMLFFLIAYLQFSECVKPVVLWHGMGDSCCNPLSLGRIKKVIESELPGVYVKSLQIGENMMADVKNSFFMNANLQIEDVCKQLAADEALSSGYNAIGFSQGGQFLRAVAQRCPNPPMRNLISLGGQHQGVYGLPHCLYPKHRWCDYVRKLLNTGAYWRWVQDGFVQAEYWHDPLHEEDYKQESVFLADINNERSVRPEYRDNLKKLENLVLVRFDSDTMVEPKETEWFGFYTPGQAVNITSFHNSALYTEDRLGLQQMEREGRLKFLSVPGDHLEFSEDWFREIIIDEYLK